MGSHGTRQERHFTVRARCDPALRLHDGPGPAITLQVRDRDKVMEPYKYEIRDCSSMDTELV
jgi:hypothetical protein